jgi:hypothetical protein
MSEYTLKQAIGILDLATTHLWEHQKACQEGVLIADDGLCVEGKAIERARAKWKRRIKAAAKREGVMMTV